MSSGLRQTCRVTTSILLLSLATTYGLAQSSGKPKPATPDAHAADNPDILRQMNHALEELAARVSPAVVQIQTTGYGPLSEGSRGETALIVRQHAVGSGVIVDSNGYIMTNAHVVEGAQRIRVALPMAVNASPGNTAAGQRPVLDAKLIGVHKESDLALLK
ncbi:MAG: trypsin-like peptidase domain-containing protein, partial [Terriglobales bacterium]